MTTLDRALMKAYQRQRVGGPHAAFPVLGAKPRPGPEERAAAVLGISESDRQSPGRPVEAPNLATVAGMPDEQRIGPAPTAAGPALEVERFDWPPIVQSLREAALDEWTTLVEHLLGGARTLLVSGCRRGEGRTTIAMLMALVLSAKGSRVGMLDADLGQPQLAARLGVSTSTGWNEAMSRGLPAAEAMVESLADPVIVLPVREAGAVYGNTVDAAAVKTAIAALHTHCELVCIDGGPLLDAADTAYDALLKADIDAALVVRDLRHSRLQQSHAVGRRLVQAGVERWAIIENFARAAHV